LSIPLTSLSSNPLKGLDEGKWNLFYELRYKSSQKRSFLGRTCNMLNKKEFHFQEGCGFVIAGTETERENSRIFDEISGL